MSQLSPEIHDEVERHPARIRSHNITEESDCHWNDKYRDDEKEQSDHIPKKPEKISGLDFPDMWFFAQAVIFQTCRRKQQQLKISFNFVQLYR